MGYRGLYHARDRGGETALYMEMMDASLPLLQSLSLRAMIAFSSIATALDQQWNELDELANQDIEG